MHPLLEIFIDVVAVALIVVLFVTSGMLVEDFVKWLWRDM